MLLSIGIEIHIQMILGEDCVSRMIKKSSSPNKKGYIQKPLQECGH